MATIVAALTCIGAARAEDIHPEDAACRLPCEVHDAQTRRAQASLPPAAATSAPVALERDRVAVAQATTGATGAKREPALARQRVAR